MADLRVVEGGPEHSDEIRSLLRLCFPENPKAVPGVIEWQYWSNPFGRTTTVLAYDGGRLVAHQTAYTLPLTIRGAPARGRIKADAATHPDHRRSGVYRRLMRVIDDLGRADGIDLFVVNPNTESRGPARSYGFVDAAEPRLLALPLDAGWVRSATGLPTVAARAVSKLFGRQLPREEARRVDGVPAGVDELATRLWDGGLAGVRPDSRWWQWRFADHPLHPYRFYSTGESGAIRAALVGRLVDRRGATSFHVMDMLADAPAGARAVLGAALADAPEAGAVTAVATAHGPQIRALRWAGLRRVPRAIRGRRTRFFVLPVSLTLDRLRGIDWVVTDGMLDHS